MYQVKTELCKNENVTRLNSRAIVFDDRFHRTRVVGRQKPQKMFCVFKRERIRADGQIRFKNATCEDNVLKTKKNLRLKTDVCGET